MKRTLTMLADDFNPQRFKAEGSFMSEKMDGVRALWLPFTRGLAFRSIPWANTLRDARDYVCSGLWSRRGKLFLAPKWFLDQLPAGTPLDGELFMGRGLFQKTTGAVRKLDPIDEEWNDITYMAFDIPSYQQFFKPGQVREGGKAGEPAYEVLFKAGWEDLFNLKESPYWNTRRFIENYGFFKNRMDCGPNLSYVEQKQLSFTRDVAEAQINNELADITREGGEGLMLRRGHSIWEPTRSKDLAKVKPLHDSEAVITGYVYGNGKYAGMVGAFQVDWKGKRFDLSGFTDVEREIKLQHIAVAEANPGIRTNENVSKHFPLGTVVTFHYNELTADGLPRFARYHRVRSD